MWASQGLDMHWSTDLQLEVHFFQWNERECPFRIREEAMQFHQNKEMQVIMKCRLYLYHLPLLFSGDPQPR